jgi:hypothetical protein
MAGPPGAAARLDPSLLELPGNSEATVRLLKARVRSLEEQLQAAIDAGAGAGRLGRWGRWRSARLAVVRLAPARSAVG